MSFKIEGSGFNPEFNSADNKKELPHDNKFSHDMDYLKGNHPNEALGRSMVNFKGLKHAYDYEALKKEVLEQGILTKEEVESLPPEDLKAKLEFYKEAKNIDKSISNTFIKIVDNSTCDYLKTFISDKNFSNLMNSFNEGFSTQDVAEGIAEYIMEDFDCLVEERKQTAKIKSDIFNFIEKNDTEEDSGFAKFIVSMLANSSNVNLIKSLCINDKISSDDCMDVIAKETKEDEKPRTHTDKAREEVYQFIKENGISIKNEDLINVLSHTDCENAKFAKTLLQDKEFPKNYVGYAINTLGYIDKSDREELIKQKTEIYEACKPYYAQIGNLGVAILLGESDFYNTDFTKTLLSDNIVGKNGIPFIISKDGEDDEINEKLIQEKTKIYEKYKNSQDIDPYDLSRVLEHINADNLDFTKKLLEDEIVPMKYVGMMTYITSKNTENRSEIFKTRQKFYESIKDSITKENIQGISSLCSNLNVNNGDFACKMSESGLLSYSDIAYILDYQGDVENEKAAFEARSRVADILLKDSDIKPENICNILRKVDSTNEELAKLLISKKDEQGIFYDFYVSDISAAIDNSDLEEKEKEKVNAEKIKIWKKNEDTVNRQQLISILRNIKGDNFRFAEKLIDENVIPTYLIGGIISTNGGEENTNAKEKIYEKYKNNPDVDIKLLSAALCVSGEATSDMAEFYIENAKELGITDKNISHLLIYKVDPKKVKKLSQKMGRRKLSQLPEKDLRILVEFADIYNKTNINEIPQRDKKEFLKALVSANVNAFNLSEESKKDFPLLPGNQEEYCSILPALVRSLGIETNTISEAETAKFNKSLGDLGNILSNLSDNEFNSLDIKQKYSKDDFIEDVLAKVKDLSPNERQKVYDYFGFELHHNNNNKTGFSITGYPANLNNGEKLAQITNPDTKIVVEELRKDVIKFSENNKIECSNKELEAVLNKIAETLPEIRPEIGKLQAGMNGTKGSHEFDIFKHSLKVMQKIVQNNDFKDLSESDKKIMLLSSLLHDITKKEGSTDKTHADEGSFDSFFIAKKFNLSQEEEIKLFTLIRNHEWLGKVNSSKDEKELDKNLKSVAYDLRHDNLFDLTLMFTHADLKAVKKDDSFHDNTTGRGRREIDGIKRSFGETADIFAGDKNDSVQSNTIRGFINELKKSQPLLPVTKIPSASRINKAITNVYSDGSTNIKGIYKDKNGLVVIKFNEVENETWEKIGFPKGSISKGIKAKTSANEDVDTGNIKFFAHGLEYSNQLVKFDVFPMPDSDALLSVSYAERPESKYRFFRPQGILLDVDTKYVHGGGETDAGSGCGKSIQEFKNNYIFGGAREKDRVYVSELIKETLNLNDEEYIKFVKENENKSFNEIEPKETREKLIKAFSGINSNIRRGKREYNEMYASNPKPPMGVFAYSVDYNEKIGNPVEFLNRETMGEHEHQSVNERTAFLKDYATKHDVPFVVFGD